MAITAFPFESADTSEEQYSMLMGEAVDTGIVGDQGSNGYIVQAGSGMTVTAGTGSGSQAVVRGTFGYTLAAEGPVTVANGDSTYTRIDLAVLRLNRATDTMTFEVVQGTPSASPVDPTLAASDSGTYEYPLARLTIPAGAGSMLSGYITDLRTFVGSTTGMWTTTTRPKTPRKGKLGYNTTLATWEWWNGSAWTTLIPSTVDNATKWNNYSIIVQSSTPAVAANTFWFKTP